jgi:cold shock CspA family protein/ribosome-associated translation inhibitor RaiA
MQIPVTIAFDGLPESDAVQQAVWKHAAELETFFPRITSCRVVIARPHHHGHQGSLYSVRVDLTVPGSEIVVSRERPFDHAHEDVYVAMRDAFRAARRRLEDHARRVRGEVKTHTPPARGRIVRLLPDEGYGFIASDDGHETYFHRNAVVPGGFDRLRIGDDVWFTEEEGERGPQASSVHLSHPHKREPAGS